MRELGMGMVLDNGGLKAGLRAISLIKEVQALEAYFIRHGASWQMMATLFKMRHKLTLQRRREVGAWRPPGRPPLPDLVTRGAIGRTWRSLRETDPGCATTSCTRPSGTSPSPCLRPWWPQFEADA